MTKIEWTEATWNPIVGCSVISPGCTNCYAMRMAHRLGANQKTPHYAGTTAMTRGGPVWTGKLALAPDNVLTAPLRRKKPTTYFVNSMGDLFHEDVPDAWIDRVFAVMALAPQHRFQILTKRADRMREYVIGMDGTDVLQRCDRQGRLLAAVRRMAPLPSPFNIQITCPILHEGVDRQEIVNRWGFENIARHARAWPLPNVWLGVSAEDQARADQRIPDLLATPAAVRFVSCEPLLGPVNLLVTDHRGHDISALRGIACDPTDPDGPDEYYRTAKLDWVIVGGESGPGARPIHPDWARGLRDQCVAAGVPFFFKQWGAWGFDEGPDEDGNDPILMGKFPCAVWRGDSYRIYDNGWPPPHEVLADLWMYRIGKARAGRLLDGREWNDLPETAA